MAATHIFLETCLYALASVREYAVQLGKHTVLQSLPPGRAARAQHNLEQSRFGHLEQRWLLGALALRIQPSILAADLRARRRFFGVWWFGFFFWFVSEGDDGETACNGLVRSSCSGYLGH